jgi:hypothetical protein
LQYTVHRRAKSEAEVQRGEKQVLLFTPLERLCTLNALAPTVRKAVAFWVADGEREPQATHHHGHAARNVRASTQRASTLLANISTTAAAHTSLYAAAPIAIMGLWTADLRGNSQCLAPLLYYYYHFFFLF